MRQWFAQSCNTVSERAEYNVNSSNQIINAADTWFTLKKKRFGGTAIFEHNLSRTANPGNLRKTQLQWSGSNRHNPIKSFGHGHKNVKVTEVY